MLVQCERDCNTGFNSYMSMAILHKRLTDSQNATAVLCSDLSLTASTHGVPEIAELQPVGGTSVLLQATSSETGPPDA